VEKSRWRLGSKKMPKQSQTRGPIDKVKDPIQDHNLTSLTIKKEEEDASTKVAFSQQSTLPIARNLEVIKQEETEVNKILLNASTEGKYHYRCSKFEKLCNNFFETGTLLPDINDPNFYCKSNRSYHRYLRSSHKIPLPHISRKKVTSDLPEVHDSKFFLPCM
jgi:hypothetical protein